MIMHLRLMYISTDALLLLKVHSWLKAFGSESNLSNPNLYCFGSFVEECIWSVLVERNIRCNVTYMGECYWSKTVKLTILPIFWIFFIFTKVIQLTAYDYHIICSPRSEWEYCHILAYLNSTDTTRHKWREKSLSIVNSGHFQRYSFSDNFLHQKGLNFAQ